MTLALLFGLVILAVAGGQSATEFYAGWLTEYSLSVDNLFVFVIIMARFQVPRKLQQEALMVGIIIALVLRGIFILLGAAVIERFTWVFYIFGAFLVYTAINLVRHRDEEDEYEENAFIRRMRKILPITQTTTAARSGSPRTARSSGRRCSSSSWPSGRRTCSSRSTASRRSSASPRSRSSSSRRTSSR